MRNQTWGKQQCFLTLRVPAPAHLHRETSSGKQQWKRGQVGGQGVNISGSLFRKFIHYSWLRCKLDLAYRSSVATCFKRNKLPSKPCRKDCRCITLGLYPLSSQDALLSPSCSTTLHHIYISLSQFELTLHMYRMWSSVSLHSELFWIQVVAPWNHARSVKAGAPSSRKWSHWILNLSPWV